jgi:hypothetical protein
MILKVFMLSLKEVKVMSNQDKNKLIITNKCLINKDKTIVDKFKININQIYFHVNFVSIYFYYYPTLYIL